VSAHAKRRSLLSKFFESGGDTFSKTVGPRGLLPAVGIIFRQLPHGRAVRPGFKMLVLFHGTLQHKRVRRNSRVARVLSELPNGSELSNKVNLCEAR
jgi:hypothetical protein